MANKSPIWNACVNGNMPEDVLPLKDAKTIHRKYVDKITETVLVTDEYKEEIRETFRFRYNHPSYYEWYWNLPINFKDNFRVMYWAKKED